MKGGLIMKFSFDECEVLNSLVDEIGIVSQEEMIQSIDNIKDNTEDPELINICTNSKSKILTMNKETFNSFISNTPIETLSNY